MFTGIKKFFSTYYYASSFFKLWIREVIGLENLPPRGPALIVSNHQSYYDFLITGSLRLDNLAFLAVAKIRNTPIIKIFTRWHTTVYVDREKPGMNAGAAGPASADRRVVRVIAARQPASAARTAPRRVGTYRSWRRPESGTDRWHSPPLRNCRTFSTTCQQGYE